MRKLDRSPFRVVATRVALMLVVALLLLGGIAGGLLRAGVAIPVPAVSAWPGHAVLTHAFLMICGFLGTVIGIERAVAAKARLAFAAPVASASAGVAALSGAASIAAWLAAFAALAFVMVNVSMLLRQKAAHIAVLLVGAVAWWVGTLLHAWGGAAHGTAAVTWWFSFLILTIAGERLEMTRLMRRRPGATASLYTALGGLLVGSAIFSLSPSYGAFVFGAALLALAAWLVRFDIARRTLASNGLSRYMAVSLLAGYAWLGIAGVAWMGTAVGYPWRDLALHALGLGFVFSMMLAHAPVILPALTRIKIQFGRHFYAPLALLQLSLAIRMAQSIDPVFLALGALGNAVAIAAFLLTLAVSALAWRTKHRCERHAVPAHH